jgi:hypothetical protein
VGGTTPQACLTILFFDERFNFIPAAGGGVAQVQGYQELKSKLIIRQTIVQQME